jgi:hypothetical protein
MIPFVLRGNESVFLRVRGGEGNSAGVDFIISLRACCGDILWGIISEL